VTVTSGVTGSLWQVSTQPSAISSASSASLTRILTSPAVMCAMQVAQFPASQEEGGERPARRALCSSVSPGNLGTDRRTLSRTIVIVPSVPEERVQAPGGASRRLVIYLAHSPC
jgi:hypothetical protein